MLSFPNPMRGPGSRRIAGRFLVLAALPVALLAGACTQQQSAEPGAATSPSAKAATTPMPTVGVPAGSPAAKSSPAPAASPATKAATAASPVVRAASPSPSPIAAGTTVTMTLEALNNSGQMGTATLRAAGSNRTEVVLDLDNSPAGPQPAHIHEGSCDNLNPTPKYPLTNVSNGASTTTVDVGLDQLMTGKLAINVHRSPQEAAVYVSCGNIPLAVDMKVQNNSGESGIATLAALPNNRTRVMLDLRSPLPGPQPAHIHEGSCAQLNPTPKYPLDNAENGKSETIVDVALDELTAGNLAINVHKSPQEAAVYVSCGDIPRVDLTGGAGPGGSPVPSSAPVR